MHRLRTHASAPQIWAAYSMINDKNFENLFRQTPEMVCILAGPEHRFEFVNQAHIRALGFDATGRTVREAQPESVEVHTILDDVYRTGKTAELREIPVTLTDRVRYFNLTYAARTNADDVIDGIMIMGTEVTDQVLARRAQENQRRWLESVLNRLPSPTLFVDPETARISFQNDAATALFGAPIHGLPLERVAAGESLRDHPMELGSGRGSYSVEVSSDLIPEEFGQPPTSLLVLKDVTSQKRIQKTLERSEEQLTLALETSKVGFYDWNIAEDVLVFSPQMRADWGIDDGDTSLTLQHALQRIHPDDRDRAQAQIGAAMDERIPFEIEYRVVRPDGRVVWLDVRGRVHYGVDGRPVRFFGTCLDVSARVESERTLRALADSMPQVVWTARPDGALDYTNERWTQYSGSDDPAKWLDFVMPLDRQRVQQMWSESVVSGQPYEAEFRLLRTSDQRYRWHLVRANAAVDELGKVTRWFGTCTDIEDQKRSELLLRFLAEASVILSSSLDYQKTIANVTRLSVPTVADWAAVDMIEPDGSLTRLAAAHADPSKEELARELWRRWPPKESDPTGIFAVIRNGRSEVHAEISDAALAAVGDADLLPMTRALGLRSSMCVPLQIRGKTIGAITFASAESGRAFAAADLRVAEDLARRAGAAIDNAHLYRSELSARKNADAANRMKDEFLATVSHELRTPLNAMLGWTRLLRTGDLPDEKRSRALETIERNAVTQAQLIEDLLDVARIVSGKLRLDVQTVEISHIVEYAIDALRLASDMRKIQVVTSIDPHAGPVMGDPHRLGQVLWNLLSNAIKFTPKDGRINVVVERVDSSLRISVTDTGQGIAPEFLPFVFERFKQEDGATTRAHGGLGLGLAISRHIVELHGGTISVSSKGEGQGSKFVVDLPLSSVRREARATSSRFSGGLTDVLEARPELANLKVLVVDDEKDARDLIHAVLESCGAVVTQASSAEEALATIAAEAPDVLLSDIGMPIEDGYSLIRKVRALADPELASIPAAALTAYARAEDRRKALDAGYMMHVPKPVEPVELVSIVASLIRFGVRRSSSNPGRGL